MKGSQRQVRIAALPSIVKRAEDEQDENVVVTLTKKMSTQEGEFQKYQTVTSRFQLMCSRMQHTTHKTPAVVVFAVKQFEGYVAQGGCSLSVNKTPQLIPKYQEFRVC